MSGQKRPISSQSKYFFYRKMARYNRERDWKRAGEPASRKICHKRPRARGVLRGAEDEHPDILVLLDQLGDFLGFHPLAHDLLGFERLEAHGFQLAPEQAEHRLRFGMSLLARDLLDGEPLKIDIGLDDVEESELASRPLRAACGKSERALAFRRFVNDDEKFPPVAFGEDLSLPPRARLACGFARFGCGLRGLFRLLLRHGVTRSWVAVAPSGKVDCVTLEVAEIDDLERRF